MALPPDWGKHGVFVLKQEKEKIWLVERYGAERTVDVTSGCLAAFHGATGDALNLHIVNNYSEKSAQVVNIVTGASKPAMELNARGQGGRPAEYLVLGKDPIYQSLTSAMRSSRCSPVTFSGKELHRFVLHDEYTRQFCVSARVGSTLGGEQHLRGQARRSIEHAEKGFSELLKGQLSETDQPWNQHAAEVFAKLSGFAHTQCPQKNGTSCEPESVHIWNTCEVRALLSCVSASHTR
eukprot:1855343-Amphidinium_carterae.1